MDTRVGIAAMPGTCGELVQGTLDGVSFHVSCPIDVYAQAEVQLGSGEYLVFPADCQKAGDAARKTLSFLGQSGFGGTLRVSSRLPRSKGMASSTADIGAAVVATVRALGTSIEPRHVADIALSIEPTDGSLFPGIVLFDHRHGRLNENLGVPPPIDVVALDFGGEVDTVIFNGEDRSQLLARLEPQIREALDLVKAGIAHADPFLVGRGATISAMANQEVLYKPQLEAVVSLCVEIGAVGVNVGHSGTVIGVLLDRRRGDSEAALVFLQRRLTGLVRSFLCSIVGGGPPDDRVVPEVAIRRNGP